MKAPSETPTFIHTTRHLIGREGGDVIGWEGRDVIGWEGGVLSGRWVGGVLSGRWER